MERHRTSPTTLARALSYAAWLPGLAALGCVGTIGSDGEPGARPDQGGNAGPPLANTPAVFDPKNVQVEPDGCVEGVPTVSPLRRLTNDEYARTVAILLDDEAPLVAQLPASDRDSPVVSAPWGEGTMQVAEELAARVVKRLDTFLPCSPANGEEICAGRFIATLGKQAYRRPLSPEENTRLLAMFKQGRAGADFAHGIELVVRTLLQSPHFLYRIELGDTPQTATEFVKLTPYEVATRLSFAMWGSMPDAVLLAAAAEGRLGTPDEIGAQARRLIADPRGQLSLRRFHEHWMGLGAVGSPLTGALAIKDTSIYTEFNPALVESMRKDTTSFIDFVLKEQGGRLEAFLTSPTAFVTADLAPLYGVPTPASGADSLVQLDATKRSGILTNVGFLAAHTKADDRAVIHRGVAVRDSFLCAPPPPPPAGVPDTPGVVLENSVCRACHGLINPIGIGFAHYDGIGRWRDTDAGQPISDVGEFAGTDDIDGPFQGVPEMAKKLLGSRQVRECVVSRFVAFALTGSADSCAHRRLSDAYVAADMDIHELAVAMTVAGGFGYRGPVTEAVQP